MQLHLNQILLTFVVNHLGRHVGGREICLELGALEGEERLDQGRHRQFLELRQLQKLLVCLCRWCCCVGAENEWSEEN